ncbi:hypothetical protein H5410_005453 [Solanum commersonii]|uniref:Uncharacterized protein n=1 Tax=Solanum commersonii TaxID=4109 RepID=A0A9J6A7G8_SOLCO|nr:hypothetical protein H5410_005453 [Solanum commersonii]
MIGSITFSEKPEVAKSTWRLAKSLLDRLIFASLDPIYTINFANPFGEPDLARQSDLATRQSIQRVSMNLIKLVLTFPNALQTWLDPKLHEETCHPKRKKNGLHSMRVQLHPGTRTQNRPQLEAMIEAAVQTSLVDIYLAGPSAATISPEVTPGTETQDQTDLETKHGHYGAKRNKATERTKKRRSEDRLSPWASLQMALVFPNVPSGCKTKTTESIVCGYWVVIGSSWESES